MQYMTGPIGVFDSGYGGLTILESLREHLPTYDFLYLGDNARAPYGSRSFDVIFEYTWQAVQFLFDQGCPLVILACNTASAKALRNIQQNQLTKRTDNNRVLGVIRPSTEALGALTKSNHVGVLATEGTVKSNSYALELAKFSPNVTVQQHACPMWVPLIENNEQDTPGGLYFIQKELVALFEKDSEIDTLLLGCTHYPILAETIKRLLPQHIQVISQGELVAKGLVDYLERHPEMNDRCTTASHVRYLTTENAELFSENASRLMQRKINATHIELH